MLSQRTATLLGLLALVFWTTSVAVVRRLVGAGAVGPLTYLAVTSLAAGTLLGLYQVLRTPPTGVRRRPTGKYLLIGGGCFVAYFGLFTISLHLAPSHAVAVQLGLVNYLWPPMVLLLSVPLLGNRANWPVLLAGVALAVGGVGLVERAVGEQRGGAVRRGRGQGEQEGEENAQLNHLFLPSASARKYSPTISS